LALYQGTPGVEALPAEHVDGAREGAEGVHCGWDCEDAGCEDDYVWHGQ
jgi:hypothetical protein